MERRGRVLHRRPHDVPRPRGRGRLRAGERDPDSLLSFVRLLVERYRACPELAWGRYTVLDPGPDAPSVLAHRCDLDGETVLALHNLADTTVEVALSLDGLAGRKLGDGGVRIGEDGAVTVELEPYGCRRLRT